MEAAEVVRTYPERVAGVRIVCDIDGFRIFNVGQLYLAARLDGAAFVVMPSVTDEQARQYIEEGKA